MSMPSLRRNSNGTGQSVGTFVRQPTWQATWQSWQYIPVRKFSLLYQKVHSINVPIPWRSAPIRTEVQATHLVGAFRLACTKWCPFPFKALFSVWMTLGFGPERMMEEEGELAKELAAGFC